MSVIEYYLGKVGITPKGAYDDGATYERLDVVTHGGGSYLSLIDDNTEPLSDDTAWQLLAKKGDTGAKGDKPDHEWSGTSLKFQKPEGGWGSPVDLEGQKGNPGVKGDKPAHTWDGTKLQFENPDGTLGAKVDLKGQQGNPGTNGANGKGWTGGSYDDETGKVTFTSTDGLGFYTDDLRGADGSDALATPVINNLESTSTTSALSAKQGSVLAGMIGDIGSALDIINGEEEE